MQWQTLASRLIFAIKSQLALQGSVLPRAKDLRSQGSTYMHEKPVQA